MSKKDDPDRSLITLLGENILSDLLSVHKTFGEKFINLGEGLLQVPEPKRVYPLILRYYRDSVFLWATRIPTVESNSALGRLVLHSTKLTLPAEDTIQEAQRYAEQHTGIESLIAGRIYQFYFGEGSTAPK